MYMYMSLYPVKDIRVKKWYACCRKSFAVKSSDVEPSGLINSSFRKLLDILSVIIDTHYATILMRIVDQNTRGDKSNVCDL